MKNIMRMRMEEEETPRRNNRNSGQRIEDAAERLGYTVDLTLGSPRFVNPDAYVLEFYYRA